MKIFTREPPTDVDRRPGIPLSLLGVYGPETLRVFSISRPR